MQQCWISYRWRCAEDTSHQYSRIRRGTPATGDDGGGLVRNRRRVILVGGALAVLSLGLAGCASNGPLSASSLTTLSVPTSAAGVQQECVNLGISASACSQAVGALQGAGVP